MTTSKQPIVLPLHQRLTERTLIARGNFAASYKALDSTLGRPVFFKVLHADLSSDSDIRGRFEREARAAARLSHRNLVQLYEFGEDPDEGLYMVFEWVQGESLAARLTRVKTLPADAVQDLARDLLEGLAVLHGAGIIHRDIKPENILLPREGGAKLADYSLAIPVDEPRMTHARAIIGTPAYMSPEQAAGRQPDERADLFSLGVVLWEAATGSNPFWAEDIVETLRRIRRIDPDFDCPAFGELPLDLQTLIRSCLAKETSQRPGSARDAMKLLQAGRAGRANHRGVRNAAVLFAIMICALQMICISRSHEIAVTPLVPAPKDLAQPVDSSQVTQNENGVDTVPALNVSEHRDSQSANQEQMTVRNPNTVGISTPVNAAASIPESADVVLDVRPWARVYLNDQDLGTTPFRRAIRLPCGIQRLSFQNAQMPPVTLAMEIRKDTQTLRVDLAQHITVLDVAVTPWGNVSIDNDVLGATPLKRPVFLTPGRHVVRISHPALTPLERSFSAGAGDTLHLTADLDHSTLSVTHSDVTHRR